MEKLDWLPLYIDKLLSSPAWNDMEDYQRGWYIQLLLRCTRSERLGYLKVDSNLWTIAGAKRRDFFESHKSAVLACFKVREMEGHQWLFNDRLLSVMEDQSQKYLRRSGGAVSPSTSPSKFGVDSKKTGEEVSLATPNLPPGSLARGMLEKIGLPVSMGNMRIVAAAIEAVALASGSTFPQAFDWLLERVQIAAARGERIDKFYFEDGRYNHDESKQPKSSQGSASQQRSERSKRNIIDGIAMHNRARASSVQPEREDGSGS